MAQSSLSFSLPDPLRHWLERHMSMERLIWLITIIIFLVAWNRGVYLLYAMFSFLVAALLMSYVGAYWQLRRISVELVLPAETHSGASCQGQLRLTGRAQLFTLSLSDDEQFLNPSSVAIDQLAGVQEQTIDLVFCRRGIAQFHEIIATSFYPFGLVRRQRKLPIPLVQTVVYPKIWPLKQLPDELQQGACLHGDMPQPLQHGQEEFSMVRDYRRGDEMKHIHWRMSAKRQSWVVKEYDSTRNPSMAVMLAHDVSWLQQGFNAIEHMLEIVASLASACTQQGYGLRILLSDQKYVDVRPFEQNLQPLMYELAMWQPDADMVEPRSQISMLEPYAVIVRFSSTLDAPGHPLPLLSHQYMMNICFDRSSYPETGLAMPIRKQQQGRETRIQVCSTSQLWGLF